MAIPAWTPGGVLPAGEVCGTHDGDPIWRGHDCTLEEVHDRLVTSFPESETRARFWTEIEQIIAELKRYIPRFNLLISGSFILQEDDPEDMFLVFDVLATDMDQMDGHTLWLLNRLCEERRYEIGDNRTLDMSVDIMRQYEPEHEKYELYSAERMLQFYICTNADSSRGANGYVEVFIVAEEEEAPV